VPTKKNEKTKKKSWITECEFLNQHKKEFYLWQNQICKETKKGGRRNPQQQWTTNCPFKRKFEINSGMGMLWNLIKSQLQWNCLFQPTHNQPTDKKEKINSNLLKKIQQPHQDNTSTIHTQIQYNSTFSNINFKKKIDFIICTFKFTSSLSIYSSTNQSNQKPKL